MVSSRSASWLAFLAAVALQVGCQYGNGSPCEQDPDCASGHCCGAFGSVRGVCRAAGEACAVVSPDAGADASTEDTGVPIDTGADASTEDTGVDAPEDAGTDAPEDTGTDAPADAGTDAPEEDAGRDAGTDAD